MRSQPPTTPTSPPGPSTPRPPSGPPKVAEVLLPVAELAALWRCSPDHIYDLIADGSLRSVQIAKGRAKTRIPESAAADFIAKQLKPSRKAAA